MNSSKMIEIDNLIYAIQNKNMKFIEEALEKVTDINGPSTRSFGYDTALCYLIKFIFEKINEIVNSLIAKGANVDKVGGDKLTPLTLALLNDKMGIAQILIARGANRNLPNPDGNTPLAHCVMKGKLEAVKYLTNIGVNVCKFGENGKPPLWWAVKTENLKMVDWLLDHGAHFNVNSLLVEAINYNTTEIFKKLIDRASDFNLDDTKKYTPLTKAIEYNNLAIVETLIKAGADVNKPDLEKNTPLIISLKLKNIEVLKILLRNSVKISEENITDFIEFDNIELIKESLNILNIKDGTKLNVTHQNGFTPLTRAVQMEYFEIVKYLVEFGVDVNQTDKENRTPLAVAIDNLNFCIFEYLIESGANLNKVAAKIEEISENNKDFKILIENLEQKYKKNGRRIEVKGHGNE